MKTIEAAFYLFLVCVSVWFSLATHVDRRTFIATDDHNPDYPTTRGLYKIKELVERESGGKMKIIVRHSAQLGSEKETIEMTQMGIIDINRVSCSPMANFAPEMGVFSLPYIFRSAEHEWKVLNGEIGKRLGKSIESRGLVTLAYYDSGARSFYNKHRPVNSPADLKGMKIRVQKNQVMVDLVNILGGSATPMAFEEVYSAIQTGVIDGAENNPPSYVTTAHYEVAKYYSLDEHTRVPEIVLFSKITWDKLSEEEKDIISRAAAESKDYQIALWAEQEKTAMDAIMKAGNKVNVPDKAPFQEAVKPLYRKYAASLGALIEDIQAVE